MDKKEAKANKRSSIGGQAVMEGVMMRGKNSMAIAVRDGDGCIRLETKRLKPQNKAVQRIPVLRGVVNFFSTFVSGIETLMRSAEVFGEAEPTKFENWLSKKFKVNLMTVVTVIALIMGIGLSIGLFILLPTFLADVVYSLLGIDKSASPIGYSFLVGGFKITVLLCYLLLVSLLKDIKRTFMYHGAEHKTISCYESGMELTVENAQKCSTLHNRCGTTFLFFVVFISIITFVAVQALLPFSIIENYFIQVSIRILILPLVAGLAYELLKFLAASDLKIFAPLRLPGLAMQKITTKQPSDDMVEVAIAAFNAVTEMENDANIPEVKFAAMQKTEKVIQEASAILKAANIDGTADTDWIMVHVLKTSRNNIRQVKAINVKDYRTIIELAKKRASGIPLQYVLGETEFYGYKIKVDGNVLIPRFETELVCEKAISLIKPGFNVLDLCTGSGCIAVAVSKKTGVRVTASDISQGALEVARENAAVNNANITFIKSDMFENITDRFDIIISNPPYIKSEEIKDLQPVVKDYEPLSALDGGEDGLRFYKIIAEKARDYLAEEGVVVLEAGEGQANDIAALFEGFEVNIYKDYSNTDRIITAKLIRNNIG